MNERSERIERRRIEAEGIGSILPARRHAHPAFQEIPELRDKLFMDEKTAQLFLRRLRDALCYSRGLSAKHNVEDARELRGLERMVRALDWALEPHEEEYFDDDSAV